MLREHRLDWFKQARFGMFIHYGLYSLLGRGEWVLNRERIPLEEYSALLKNFTAEHCDPKAWARLAKQAGMRYVVLTTKHHEGFCLWDSKLCPFNSTRSAAKRDLLAEFVEALRGEGLRIGLYYSLGDWRNPDWTLGFSGDQNARHRFMEYTHGLVRELMTGYGKVDVLWYDLPQCYSAAEWRSVDLNAMVRNHQPEIAINNRALTAEDFGTPEQHVTAAKPGRPWEACMTLNNSWGYCAGDIEFKSAKTVARNLANASAGGGNLLLNVGPDGSGQIPLQSEAILKSVGQWLQRNGEAIYDTQRHELPFNLWGPTTVSRKSMFMFLDHLESDIVTVGGLTSKVLKATHLGTGQALPVSQNDTRTRVAGLQSLRDPVLDVIRLDLSAEPGQDTSTVIGGADKWPDLPN